MKRLDPSHYQFLQFLEELKITEKEPLLLLAILCALLAIFLALLGIRKMSRGGASISGGMARVNSMLQEMGLKFNDFVSKSATENAKLKDEVRANTERLTRLEREFALLTRRSHEELEKDLKKHEPPAAQPSQPSPPPARPTEKKTEFLATADLERPDLRLADGLKKTRESFFGRLRGIFTGASRNTEELFQSLEELLISSDVGVKTTNRLLAQLRENNTALLTEANVLLVLREELLRILRDDRAVEINPSRRENGPLVVLMVGVNGAGKTTSIAKLSSHFKSQGARVILAGCDTFRAAAVEQLAHWATRIGVDIVSGNEGAKPSTVAYQAVHRGQDENYDTLIIDTAGRLHTRVNLMNELGSLVSLVQREQPGAPHETLLVVDASTGQNALEQAREFNELVKLSGVIVTKLDGTPKGGIVVAIKSELGIPVRYVGVGESVHDLKPFSAEEFVEGLLAQVEPNYDPLNQSNAEVTRVKRRRKVGEELLA